MCGPLHRPVIDDRRQGAKMGDVHLHPEERRARPDIRPVRADEEVAAKPEFAFHDPRAPDDAITSSGHCQAER
jgi:hypothetical protein